MAVRRFRFALQIRRPSPLGLRFRLRPFLRPIVLAGLTCVGLAVESPIAFGQLGQTGFGQTGFGQTGFGQTGFGQTGQTGLGQGGQAGGLGLGDALTSGLGQSGQSGFGANPFGVGGLSGQALSPYGRNGLIGSSTTGGAAGGGTAANTGGALGAANNLGGLTGAALNNRSLQSTLGGLGGRNTFGRGGLNQNQNQNSNKSKIRATVTLGFDAPATTDAAASRLVNDRLRRIPSLMLKGITVDIVGRTAVVRGQVNSPSDAKVIERLLSLEPGIDAVKNELTYANGQSAAPAAPSTSSSTTSSSSSRTLESNTFSESNLNAGTSAVQAAPEIVPVPSPR